MYSYRKKLNYVLKNILKMLHIFNHYENKKYSKFYRSNKNANVIKLSREIYLKNSPKL